MDETHRERRHSSLFPHPIGRVDIVVDIPLEEAEGPVHDTKPDGRRAVLRGDVPRRIRGRRAHVDGPAPSGHGVHGLLPRRTNGGGVRNVLEQGGLR